MAHRLFTVCNSSGSRETTNHPSIDLGHCLRSEGPISSMGFTAHHTLAQIYCQNRGQRAVPWGGVLSLWWGGANSIAGLGEVVAFLRGKEVLGGMRTLLLSPTSATTNSETLLVSISIK